jgi:hypothetical protein
LFFFGEPKAPSCLYACRIQNVLAQIGRVVEPNSLIVQRAVKRLGSKRQIRLRLWEWLDRQSALLKRGNRPMHLERIYQNFLNARVEALKLSKVELQRRLEVHRRAWRWHEGGLFNAE